MLFRKDVPRVCACCEHAVPLDASDLLCRKNGVVHAQHVCRRFRYDPTKRLPPPKVNPDLELDFKIDPKMSDF